MLLSCGSDLNDLIYEFNGFKEPICVKAGASGITGRGWADALPTIQSAINIASADDEIWVAGDQTIISVLSPSGQSIAIYGGFSGNESKRDEAKGMSRITVSTGAFISTSAPEITLDRLIISNNQTDANVITLLQNTDAIITNCTFENNGVSSQTYGAIFLRDTTKLLLINCSFNDNEGSQGAAIYSISGNALILRNCSFNNNSVKNNDYPLGGAIYSQDTVTTIENCIFTDNSATDSGSSGGAICCTHVTLILSDSRFYNNSSSLGGAVICNNSNLKISNCSFSANQGSSMGGAFFLTSNCNAEFTDTVFENNSASSGGAIYKTSDVSLNLENCTFSGNTPNDIN